MPDHSNPTSRVMDVINFLAAHPSESFTLAEIARHVGLTNGSAHRLLTTMTAGQFLSRHAKHRTYSLGLALVAVGQAAIEKHRGIDIARREIARLAQELGLQCSANALADGDILVLIREGAPRSNLGLTRVGERRTLAPPLGLCHVAWSGEAAIQAYLDRSGPHVDAAVRDHLTAAMPIIRRRGYGIAAGRPDMDNNRLLIPNEAQILDLAEAAAIQVRYISAPVFSTERTVAFQLVLSGLPSNMGLTDIQQLIERLCACAAHITSETHGRVPG
jgi:DNA-binding IclR family transcriptional regulator